MRKIKPSDSEFVSTICCYLPLIDCFNCAAVLARRWTQSTIHVPVKVPRQVQLDDGLLNFQTSPALTLDGRGLICIGGRLRPLGLPPTEFTELYSAACGARCRSAGSNDHVSSDGGLCGGGLGGRSMGEPALCLACGAFLCAGAACCKRGSTLVSSMSTAHPKVWQCSFIH